MSIKLYIQNINTTYEASSLAADDITLITERRGSPAKLTFKIARDIILNSPGIEFYEGNNVKLIVDDIKMFNGYIFSKSRTKEQIITVTAYDQTRYLKNSETLKYENKKASDVIKMIAEDYKLKIGEIEDTGYLIPSRIEDNASLWDIILNALDITNINTSKLYIFYDDFGSLTLKSIDKMILPMVLVSDSATMLDFNYTTDIDNDTYNKVKLYRDNEKKREVFVAQDSLSQMKWGILQYTQEISEHYSEAKIKQITDLLLKQKNRVNRTLSIEDIGDLSVRAGCTLHVKINDAGESIDGMLVIEQCTHTFKNNEHTMKLNLIGLEGIMK